MQDYRQVHNNEVRFHSDSMRVLTPYRTKNLGMPLVKGPVNFTVMMSNGKYSNRWSVDVDGKGDVDVFCRDNPINEKVSLQASQGSHISLNEHMAKSVAADSRFENSWNEPKFDSAPLMEFILMFPPWCDGLDPSEFPKRINKDELLIVGHDEKVVMVGFFVVDAESSLRADIPHIVLGELEIGREKTLQVIAWKEPPRELLELIRRTFPVATPDFSKMGLGSANCAIQLQGYRRTHSAYLVTCPIRYTTPMSEQIIRDTSVRRQRAIQALADR